MAESGAAECARRIFWRSGCLRCRISRQRMRRDAAFGEQRAAERAADWQCTSTEREAAAERCDRLCDRSQRPAPAASCSPGDWQMPATGGALKAKVCRSHSGIRRTGDTERQRLRSTSGAIDGVRSCESLECGSESLQILPAKPARRSLNLRVSQPAPQPPATKTIPTSVPITYTSGEQIEVYRFSIPVTVGVPLLALFLQAFLPQTVSILSPSSTCRCW